jgi:hypothetical protein
MMKLLNVQGAFSEFKVTRGSGRSHLLHPFHSPSGCLPAEAVRPHRYKHGDHVHCCSAVTLARDLA